MLAGKKNIKCVVFDLDGTIYFGTQLAPHAKQAVAYARQKAGHVFFATNNSALPPRAIYERLQNFGIDLSLNEVLTSSFLMAQYLLEHHITHTLTIGTENLKNFLEQQGIAPFSKNPQALVVGYNPRFTIKDLDPALNYLPKEYLFVAANQDLSYPVENGWLTPGAGAIVHMAQAVLHKKPDVLIGKPSPFMLSWISAQLNLQPEQILMIGDQYYSDIQMAEQWGALALLITNQHPNPYRCPTIDSLTKIEEFV